MYESQRLIVTTPDELIHGIYLMKRDGWRLVQIHCVRVEEGFELNYTFDKDLEFVNYRVILPIEQEIVSISRIFSPAFLYENELKDLFGVKIGGITIDYDGNLYRVAQKTPFKEYVPPQPAFPAPRPVVKPAAAVGAADLPSVAPVAPVVMSMPATAAGTNLAADAPRKED